MQEMAILVGLGAAAAALCLPALRMRLELSKAKHPSLTGHARIARRVAALVPYYAYDEERFFRSDAASPEVADRRRAGFAKLEGLYRQRYARSAALTAEAQGAISDLQFTSRYRVPFQYSRYVRERLKAGAFLQSSEGVTVTDLDGNRFYDLAGSYGVNLFGTDFYKRCMAEGSARAAELGPVLGGYHPAVAHNVRCLREISGLDEVSFHMSGTEAVMQAVRLARFHTRRTHLVRFCGAYHGWWEGVQPGIGNPVPQRETYTLRDMDERSLKVLRRRRDIACVLVNPLQALHPNANAPSDGSLVDSARGAHFDRAAYTAWLERLREVCSERGIVLVFDEVFVGFRLAPGGAHAALPRRPARGHLLRARHLQRASHRDVRHAGVPRTRPGARDPRDVPGTGRAVEWTCALAQRAARAGGPAGARREPLLDLDRLLPAPVALQLDAAVLPARRGPVAQLGGNGKADLQPQLHRGGFRRGVRALRRRRGGDGAGRVVVVRPGPLQPRHQARHPARDDRATLLAALGPERRVDQLAAHQRERSLVVELQVVEGIGEELGHPHEPRLHVADEEQVHRPEQQAACADHQPDLAGLAHELGGVGSRLERAEQPRVDEQHRR